LRQRVSFAQLRLALYFRIPFSDLGLCLSQQSLSIWKARFKDADQGQRINDSLPLLCL
jgi:hypothetical protein